jgi:phytanoyl-CoA hydroxylase
MAMKKFSVHDLDAIKAYYNQHGYVVVGNILNLLAIDAVLAAYEEIKYNKYFLYFSQSVHLPLRPELTREGYIKESMQDPAKLKFFPQFSGAIMACLVDPNVVNVISTISGTPKQTMKQSMFFDLSTGTIEHQDHWYLDSNPPGKMIAAWYALEDIHEDAGCFFVLPGSHQHGVIENSGESGDTKHDAFVQQIQKKIAQFGYEYRSCPLKKGDVLFWHPYLIHGAYSNKDPQYSRKSLTAHFQPSHLEHLYRGKLPAQRTVHPDVKMGGRTGGYLWNAKLYADYFINKLTRRKEAVMDMRRQSHSLTE